MPKQPKADKDAIVKTSLALPADVWRDAKVQALDERRDFQDVVADALRAYVREHRRKGGAR